MRKTSLLIVMLSTATWAGETLLGTIIVSDGGTATNRTTGWTAYACPANTIGGCFVVNPLDKISIQCDQAAFVATDVAGCDAGRCVELGAKQFFTTTVNTSKQLTGGAYNSDGGTAGHAVTYTGGWVAAAANGSANAVCRVFGRKGDE